MNTDIYELKDETTIQEQVFAAQIKLLYKNLLVSVIANLICAALVFFGLYQIPENIFIKSWFAAVIFVTLIRFLILYIYKHSSNNFSSLNLFIFGVILSASLWGIVDSFLMPKGELMQQMIVIVIIAGVTAGGSQSLNASLTASIIYISLIVAPLCAWLFLQNNLIYFILGTAMTLYLLFMLITSARSCNLSKQELTLYYENLLLVKKLYFSNEKLEESYKTLEQHENEIILLGKMSGVLQTCKDLQESYDIIIFAAKELFGRFNGCLGILNSSTNNLEIIKQWGDSQHIKAVFNTSDCWAIRKGYSYFVPDTTKDVICYHFNSPPGAYVCLPLILESGVMGLFILHADNKEIFAEYKPQLAANFCETIQLSLSNIMLHEELYEQSIRDPLTGLYNRRYMDETLARELKRAFRENKSLCVAMLDLDNFKRFNDVNGHEAGDEVLTFMGIVLKENFRMSDVACRFGGEEFLIILTDSNLSTAYPRLDALRKQIKNGEVFFNHHKLPPITISIGIAEAIKDGSSVKEIIDAADKALYAAKAGGRDRVEVLNNITHDSLDIL